jgi:hypothetical protein
MPQGSGSSFDDDNVQDKNEEETALPEFTNCSCFCCLGSSSRKQKNRAFTLVDCPGSSSNGRAMKILVMVGILILVAGGASATIWIIFEEESFFEIRRHKWWQLYFNSPGVYVILRTSPPILANPINHVCSRKQRIPWLRFPIIDQHFLFLDPNYLWHLKRNLHAFPM